MEIIKKEKLYKEYDATTITVSKYWEQVEKDGNLTKDELIAAKQLTNDIYYTRKVKNINKVFIDLFTMDNQNNTCNLANQMGADIGGIANAGLKVIFMNVEMGVNICLNNPKSEDAEKYLKIFELFNLGLENVEQYRKVLSFYHLDEKFESKPKTKQQKI